MSNLIAASELAARIGGEAPPRVLDVRYRLDAPDGRAAFAEGHIPGAVYVDMDTELATHGRPDEGRHPMPSTATLQDAARRWGLNDGDLAVVYDDWNSFAAARAWWLLRQAGVDVRVLDGGWSAWQQAGGAVEPGPGAATPGNITLTPLGADALSIDEAASLAASGVLIDARAPERFRGEVEPLDPIAGHIPGAVNVPTTAHLAPDGTLQDAAAIRATLTAAGIDTDMPIAAYCGSGVTAAHTALALAEAGIDAKVYAGSWSQWSNTPGRPVATGAE